MFATISEEKNALMSKETFEGYRLSPQQKHLWLLLRNGTASAYQVQCEVLIEGEFHQSRLKAAVEQVAKRHESLRTGFQSLPGMSLPLQVIGLGELEWGDMADLSGLSVSEQEAAIESLLDQARRRPGNIDRGTPIHATVGRLSALRHFLLISLSALCADAASLPQMVREIASSYQFGTAGSEPTPETARYLVVCEWLNELLVDDEAEPGRQYWRKLRPADALDLRLPFEKSGPSEFFEPKTVTEMVPRQTLDRLRELAGNFHTSLEAILLSCWQTLLWRWIGPAQVNIGACFDGRTDEELGGIIGLLSKYLPICCQIEDSFSLSQVVEQAQQDMLRNSTWQECFSWDHFDHVPVEHAWSVCFEFNDFTERFRGGAEFSISRWDACIDRFKLKLSCAFDGSCLMAKLHYDANCFDREEVRRLAGQFLRLLTSAVERPASVVCALDFLTPAEQRQLLQTFNQTAADYPLPSGIHQLFEEQARRAPDNIAAIFEQQRLTYSELNARANQVARYLRKAGIGAEVLVPIYMERSLEMMIALLGVLKSGGAYVPIDPDYPSDRVAFMLQDIEAKLLLSQAALRERLPQLDTRIVCLDADWSGISKESSADLDSGVQPDHLAYVIYTSGSTGRPKGAMNVHRGIVNRQLWMQDTYRLVESDRVLQLSSFSFDFSVWEFLGPSSAGAAVVIPRPGGQHEHAYLAGLIEAQKVTVVHFVPSMLWAFIREGGLENLSGIKHVFCGGETLPHELQEHFSKLSQANLHNQYGPTETSIDVTYWDCPRNSESEVVPIGRPNANNSVYLLSAGHQLSPVGGPGELHIGGFAVGRGYHNNPDLTAEKFIPHPFSHEPGARLYKTGDLARHLSDGVIEYLGRLDHQVKIRGFRIETGEIEAVLIQHPAVQQVVVTASGNSTGQQRLVAYLVTNGKPAPQVGELRRFLSKKLPEHMIPSVFMRLEKLPLNPNGKVNRNALPASDEVRPEGENIYTASRTPIDELIEGIWCELLRLERIGIHDNFFDLGGHSLLATQFVSRLRSITGIELPVRYIFDAPTISGLTERFEMAGRLDQSRPQPPLIRATRQTPLPLSYGQQRLWFWEQLEPGGAAYNVPAAVRLKGPLEIEALERALNRLIERHESLRTVFRVEAGKPVQVIEEAQWRQLPVEDLCGVQPELREGQVAARVEAEAGEGFDLSRGPLLRMKVLKLEQDEHVVLLTAHHIIADAWSMTVLVSEIGQFYRGEVSGESVVLEELAVQYADYAVWERQWLEGGMPPEEMEYWRKQLDGVEELRLVKERGGGRRGRQGRHERVEIGAEVTRELRKLSRREGVTLFMTTLAAFLTLLYRYSGQHDIAVGTPVAGRHRREVEGVIGFFINTLVLRTDLGGNPRFSELLQRVRETALGGYAHQSMPFEKLIDELQPRRDGSRIPFINVWFALHQYQNPSVEIPGGTISPVEVQTNAAKLDLALIMTDTADGLLASFGYDADLFDAEMVAEMAQNFRALLAVVAQQSEVNLLDIPLSADPQAHLIPPVISLQKGFDNFQF